MESWNAGTEYISNQFGVYYKDVRKSGLTYYSLQYGQIGLLRSVLLVICPTFYYTDNNRYWRFTSRIGVGTLWIGLASSQLKIYWLFELSNCRDATNTSEKLVNVQRSLARKPLNISTNGIKLECQAENSPQEHSS